MKFQRGAWYILSAFCMLAVHADTLEAPTLVYEDFGSIPISSGLLQRPSVASVRNYLGIHMKEAAAPKIDRLSRLIVRLSREHHLPSGLILSIIKVESNFRPWATSPRGALGLMQLMPETGEWMAQRYGIAWDGPATLLDEEKNATLGIKYLAYLRGKYGGSLEKALSAYNRGPAKVDEEVSGHRSGTLKYYQKVKFAVPRFALGDMKIRRSNVANIE